MRRLTSFAAIAILALVVSGAKVDRTSATTSPANFAWFWRPPPYLFPSWGGSALYPYPVYAARALSQPGTIFIGTVDACLDIACPAGTPPHGIYKTTDFGHSWQFLTGTDPLGGMVAKIVVDPASPSVILAGYSYGYSTVGQNVYGIYLSRDDGASWTNVLPQVSILDIEFDPSNPATVYATGVWQTQIEIYKSTDTGQTWQKISAQGMVDLVVDPSSSNVLFGLPGASTTPPFVYRSTDSGVTWSPLPAASGMWVTPSQLLINPKNPSRIYAFGGGYNGIWRSDDSGQSWSDVTSNLPDIGFGKTVLSAAIDPVDNATVWVGLKYDGIFSSSNGGASWTAENSGMYFVGAGNWGASCGSIALSPDGQHAAVCSPYGLVYVRGADYQAFLPVVASSSASQTTNISTRHPPQPSGSHAANRPPLHH